jgi:deoxycytidine triphosphate deaminase
VFLNDKQLKEFDFYRRGYETVSNTLVLHIAKEFKKGVLFEKSKDFDGEFIGGLEYPRHKIFWSEEQVTLNAETIGLVFGRQKMATDGILVFPGFIHPGFDGRLLISVINLGNKAFLEKRAGIAYVAFAKSNPVEKTFDVSDWYKNSLDIRGID